ncbi:MAG: energy-coupling factor transporter ATPase [Clostridiales bacterium]|nr:energy-coupling factor transporter ATPase [Clostridiales bacterium]
MPLLEFKNVDYAYPSGDSDFIQALCAASLSVERGEFVALVGCNGSGKSTLARLANGLLLPDRGDVLVDGMTTVDKANLYEIRKKIGVVFQNPDNQMVTTIVEDDIAFGPENLGLPPAEIRERVDWALRCVGMSEHAKSGPFRLSGGQKQRIAIAGVLAIKPELMILDEATGMLDPDGRREVMEVVKRLNREEGRAVIMITHFMEEAAEADRIIILNGGKVVADGGRELFKTPEVFTTAGLDLPLPVRLSSALRARGIDVGNPINIDEFVAAAAARIKGEAIPQQIIDNNEKDGGAEEVGGQKDNALDTENAVEEENAEGAENADGEEGRDD